MSFRAPLPDEFLGQAPFAEVPEALVQTPLQVAGLLDHQVAFFHSGDQAFAGVEVQSPANGRGNNQPSLSA